MDPSITAAGQKTCRRPFGGLGTRRSTRGGRHGSKHGLILALLPLAAAMWTTPKDGRSPKDERERTIQSRSHTIGYYVLMVLILSLGVPLHLYGFHAHQLMGLAALDLVIAGFVVAVAQIVMFRRGF